MPLLLRVAFGLALLAGLACGKVTASDDDGVDRNGGANDAGMPDAQVECTVTLRGDECTGHFDCPVGWGCVDSGRSAPSYQEACSDGTFRGTSDLRAVLVCREGANGCVEDDFHEECATDDECPEGARCVDSGRSMPSYSSRCPDGSSSGSSDLRVVHECREGADGGS